MLDEDAQRTIKGEDGQDSVLQCSRCVRDENESALSSVRMRDSNKWVCARCLPALIHG